MTNIYRTTEKGSLRFWDDRIKNDIEKLSKEPESSEDPSGWVNGGRFDSSYSNLPNRCWFNIKEKHNKHMEFRNMTLFTDRFECESTEDEKTNIRSEKVKLWLSTEHKTLLKKWFGVFRYVYNTAIHELKKYSDFVLSLTPAQRKLKENKLDGNKLRDKIIGSEKNKKLPDWVYEVPSDVRNDAVRDAWKAYRALIKSRSNKIHCELHYCKKKETHSITIGDKGFTGETIYVTKSVINGKKITGKLTGKRARVIQSDGNARLSYVKKDGYYLHKVINEPRRTSESQGRSMIALDPGVRTFMTSYEPNMTADIGSGAVIRVAKLKNAQINLLAKMKKVNAEKRKGLKKAYGKIKKKITNLIDELHWKTIAYIMQYDIILLPSFEVKGMIKRSDHSVGRIRKITKKTVSDLLLLQHYKFKMRLINKVKASPDHMLFIVNESYTSKTCSSCGYEHTKLGSSKTFNCPKCSMNLDRDVNGARNIFHKYVHLT
jgi:putative transposase